MDYSSPNHIVCCLIILLNSLSVQSHRCRCNLNNDVLLNDFNYCYFVVLEHAWQIQKLNEIDEEKEIKCIFKWHWNVVKPT